MTLKNTEEILDLMKLEAERCYPDEACGFVLGVMEGGTGVASEFIAAKNIQNSVHAQDPARYPRNANTAYTIDAREMEAVKEKARISAREILAIFHSHPEHEVYFSAEDKEMAAPWGEPLFPTLSYLVLSVYAGRTEHGSEFYWDAQQKDFLEKKIF